MKNGFLSIGLLVASCLSSVSYAQKLQLLTENLPPVNMSKAGKNYAKGDDVSGIATDIVRLMCAKAGMDCVITLKFPWDRIYNSALERKGYGLFSASRTEERDPLFKWVGPITQVKWVVYKLSTSPVSVSKLDDLKTLRVGGYKGDAVSIFLENNGVLVQTVFEDKQNVDKLLKGQIDVWATGSLSGPYLAKEAGLTGLKEVFVLQTRDLWLAMNKQVDDDIITKLNRALKEIKSTSEYEAIYAKYR
jgi:polar amino acid transport system substrate-binding protein